MADFIALTDLAFADVEEQKDVTREATQQDIDRLLG